MIEVEKRDAPTRIEKSLLLDFSNPALQNIFPLIGTTVHSHEWATYRALENESNYAQFTVNQYSLQYLNPPSQVRTQTIEMLLQLKHSTVVYEDKGDWTEKGD